VKTEWDLPPAWLAIVEYPNGRRWVRETFASRERAERYCAGLDPSLWYGSPRLVVEEDHPGLRAVLDGVAIRTPQDLTVRRNWFERHRSVLAPHLHDPRQTVAFTFEKGEPPHVLSTRLDGPCPLPRGLPWPACGGCGAEMDFVGVLDFRGTPEHERVPGDALVFHCCAECPAFGEPEAMSAAWLREGHPVDVHPPRVPGRIGTPWLVTEYSKEEQVFYEPEFRAQLGGDQSVYSLVACMWATKIGGHVPWIQNPSELRCTRHGPMRYAGQFFGGSVELGDSGVAYVLVCPHNGCGATNVEIQCM
jgi:hypothetical protein